MFRSSSAMPFFRIAVIRGVRLHRTNRQSVSSVRDDFSFLPPRAEHPIRFVRRSSCLATFPASRPPPRPDRTFVRPSELYPLPAGVFCFMHGNVLHRRSGDPPAKDLPRFREHGAMTGLCGPRRLESLAVALLVFLAAAAGA